MNVYILTTDLPFFPGKNGHDFFNSRELAKTHRVEVISVRHPHFPEAGIANLREAVDGLHAWPESARPVPLPPLQTIDKPLQRWIRRLPEAWRQSALLRLLGLHDQPAECYDILGTFSNFAPHLLAAWREHPPDVLVLLQSNTGVWLPYLPTAAARMVYFHDVRTHVAQRALEAGSGPAEAVTAARRAEQTVAAGCEVAGFVSELDARRATELVGELPPNGVAPIPVDPEYYTPRPADFPSPDVPSVLFTGHLGYEPNVDAIEWFLDRIWPEVKRHVPAARFVAAGLFPSPRLGPLCAAAPDVELHANVPDIRPYFWRASAYTVPMRLGGGVRQKIFEAWLMELPVVCTTMAAEGTGAVSGEHLWLEDEPAAFAGRLVRVLRGEDRAVCVAARCKVLATQTPAAAGACFRELVERAPAIRRQRPYRVLLDLRWMRPGHAGGIEQLAHALVTEMSRLDRRNSFRLLCPANAYSEWRFPRGFDVRCLPVGGPERAGEALRSAFTARLAESLGRHPIVLPAMRGLARWSAADFDFTHAFNTHIHEDLALFPAVVTVPDLQHLHHPEFFSPEVQAGREAAYGPSCAAARHLICISEFTRQDVHARYGIPLERMTTIWPIPDASFGRALPPAEQSRLLGALGLTEQRYLLYPAHSWPHKNHARLLAAFSAAVSEMPPDVRLVLTGRPFEADHPARALLAQPALAGRVCHLGYRTPREMRALYAGALALVFPSLFEGFGLPVAEAMLSGCPVACSRLTALPEVAGEAALYFDPLDSDDLARSLLRLVREPELRAELRAAGQQRRGRFGARLPAVQTLAVYQKAFDGIFPALLDPASSA